MAVRLGRQRFVWRTDSDFTASLLVLALPLIQRGGPGGASECGTCWSSMKKVVFKAW
jgi:hypothetical protein